MKNQKPSLRFQVKKTLLKVCITVIEIFSIALLLSTVVSCSTTTPLLLRSVDFMSPRVETDSFSGEVGLGLNMVPTELVLFEGMGNDLEKPIALGRAKGYPTTFAIAHLALLRQIGLYYIDSTYGMKWQFLGDNKPGTWSAAVKGGFTDLKYSSVNSNASNVSYSVKATESGVSLGYQFENILPYLSFVRRFYVASSSSARGARVDQGAHSTGALGFEFSVDSNAVLGQNRKGILGLEFAHTDANWDNQFLLSDELGIKFSVHW